MAANKSHYWVYPLTIAGYAWLLWSFTTSSNAGTVCLFKHVTGLACPSCGSTRSILSIIEGDLDAAFMLNPLGFLALLALAAVPIIGIWGALKNRNLIGAVVSWFEAKLRQPTIALPLVALVLCNWVWNMFKGL